MILHRNVRNAGVDLWMPGMVFNEKANFQTKQDTTCNAQKYTKHHVKRDKVSIEKIKEKLKSEIEVIPLKNSNLNMPDIWRGGGRTN